MFIRNFAAVATTPARKLVLELGEAAIEAASPRALIRNAVTVENDVARVGRRTFALRDRRIMIFGAGKASAAMAAALEDILGADRITGGLVITVAQGKGSLPSNVRVVFGDHPIPGSASVRATQELLAAMQPATPKDLIFWLISGGASALLSAPVPGITLAEKQAVNQLLLRSGATIDEMNAVRKHLSSVKGGRLAQRLTPARVITLALSDVVSNRLDVIGSGPTAPDPTTYSDALAVLERNKLQDRVPPSVLSHLQRGARGELPETAKPADPCFAHAMSLIVGSPRTAAEGAVRAARAAGFRQVHVLTDQLTGEARDTARVLGSIIRYRASVGTRRPRVMVLSGETTVTVRGKGAGGRCQELAAALAPEIAGLEGCAIACLSTDGRDYVEGVGGAVVDGETHRRGLELGLRIDDVLADNDTFAFHQRLGTLVEMQPTGTNVCDIVVAVIGQRQQG